MGLWAAVAALLVGAIFAIAGKYLLSLSGDARLDTLLYVFAGTFVLEYFNASVRDWLIDAAGKLLFLLLLIGGIGKIFCWNCSIY